MNETELTFPLILMRMGGLDGVALQKREYRFLLNDLDLLVHAITGKLEKEFTSLSPIGHTHVVLDELDFYHPDSQLLFANEFTHGSEKDGVKEISDSEWHDLFIKHKNKIRDDIDKELQNIPNNTPVIVYNLISLRHAQPAAAAAIKELIIKYPNRGFLSHAADPDAERPEKIARIKKHILPVLSAFEKDKPYSGGPYNLNNLYHIVLNPTQRDNFINKYDIPHDHIFEIPDFLEFKTKTPEVPIKCANLFLPFLSKKCIIPDNGSCKYIRKTIEQDTVFFISPVRPVYRKRLKEAMLTAMQYEKHVNKKVVFIVTHPNIDDKEYFQDSLEFAYSIGLDYYHLGEDFTLETLDFVYDNLATLPTIGVVASSAGGWENALNEMAKTYIPFFMSNSLNSFIPITEEIGIKTYGMDFIPATNLVEKYSSDDLRNKDLSEEGKMKEAFEFFDELLDKEKRTEIVKNNYVKAYKYLSHQATTPKLLEALLYIYARHGLPGQPGEACLK